MTSSISHERPLQLRSPLPRLPCFINCRMVVALDPSKRSEQCSPVHPLLIGMIHLQERHILGLHGQPRLRLALCVLGRPSSIDPIAVFAAARPHRLTRARRSGARSATFDFCVVPSTRGRCREWRRRRRVFARREGYDLHGFHLRFLV
jgi:hypothetical protein